MAFHSDRNGPSPHPHAPNPGAPTFIPQNQNASQLFYQYTESTPPQGYVDCGQMGGAYVDPSLLMAHPPQMPPALRKDLVTTSDGSTNSTGCNKQRNKTASISGPPPSPPVLHEPHNLRCPTPNIYELRTRQDTLTDQMNRLLHRVDHIEQTHNQVLEYVTLLNEWTQDISVAFRDPGGEGRQDIGLESQTGV